MTGLRQEELRARLRELGFDDVRFAAAAPVLGSSLQDWIDAGLHADMQWMARTLPQRLDPQQVLAGARSLILLGVNYGTHQPAGAPLPEAAGAPLPIWARYALHEDYHDTFKPGLVAAGRLLEQWYGLTGNQYRYYTDAGPVVERGWAARAGLGFRGKNGMLISRRFGNWLLLAAILTPLDFVPDPPLRVETDAPGKSADERAGLLCGKCTRCLDACPTRAFTAPGVVDARRCISYQTIENKGIIPRELRTGIGLRVFGCDVCLEVCPWNRFAQEARRLLLVARSELRQLTLRDLLSLTPETFATTFRRTPVKRTKLAGILRNACIAAGNSGDAALVPLVAALAGHANPLVRAHAVWAVYRLSGEREAAVLLADARERETDASVLAEYSAGEGSP